MKLNAFHPASPLFPFRWYLVYALLIGCLLLYADLTGWRLFDFSSGSSWASRGAGYHK